MGLLQETERILVTAVYVLQHPLFLHEPGAVLAILQTAQILGALAGSYTAVIITPDWIKEWVLAASAVHF